MRFWELKKIYLETNLRSNDSGWYDSSSRRRTGTVVGLETSSGTAKEVVVSSPEI